MNSKFNYKIKKFLKDRYIEIIITLILWAVILFCFYYIEPRLKFHYLTKDLDKFSAIYYLLTFIFVSLPFLVIFHLKKRLNSFNITNILIFIISMSMYAFLFQDIIKDIILSLNFLEDKNVLIEEYKMVKYNDTNIIILFNQDSDKNIILNSEIISEINLNRIKKEQIPISQVNNGDTIKVQFYKGLFGIYYLK